MAYGSGGFRGGGNRGGGFRGGGGFRRRFSDEKHKIKCAECGKEDEVPFKPREGTPVYCKECYFKRKGITPREHSAEKPAKKEEFEEEAEEAESEESGESEEY
jgi:CxxC-x17-CxxC domain-containing protein